MSKSIGGIEFRSIAKGIEVANEMVKKVGVSCLILRSICPGKFMAVLSGNEEEVTEAINYGQAIGKEYVIDIFVLHRIHPQVINGLKHQYEKVDTIKSIAIMETNKVCSGFRALDKALKSSNVKLIKLQVASGIGGKCVFMLESELSSLEYGLDQAKAVLEKKDIIYTSVIPSIDSMVVEQLIK